MTEVIAIVELGLIAAAVYLLTTQDSYKGW